MSKTMKTLFHLQHWTINFYKRPSLRYNIEYWNVSWNFSIYDHATKDKPVDLVPELNINVAKDLVRMRMSIKVTDLSTNEINIEQTINLCTLNAHSVTGLVVKPVLDAIQQQANFKFQCPYKKDQHLRIKEYNLRNAFLPFKPNTRKSFGLKITEGKKLVPIMFVEFYYTKVEVYD
ncbi:hypothetical protein ACKWTF_014859 [Chironomus riparius]